MSESNIDIVVDQISPDQSVVAVITAAVSTVTADSLPEERLYDRVDPDILDWVVNGENDGSVRVAFEYAGCEITVRGDGTVTVIPRLAPRSGASLDDIDLRNDLGDVQS